MSQEFAPESASAWVERFGPLVPEGGPVLDLACGRGRNGRFFLARGHPVVFLDRDVSGVSDLDGRDAVEIVEADLEDGSPWPLSGRRFAAVVVTNYLHRPLFPDIVAAVAPGGLLVYETFARGNEIFGRPRNPDYLLMPGELLDVARPGLDVLAYQELEVTKPHPAKLQRVAARAPVLP